MEQIDVKKLRKTLGLSQSALAKEIGVHQATVWRWEQGRCLDGYAIMALERFLEKNGDSNDPNGTHTPSSD